MGQLLAEARGNTVHNSHYTMHDKAEGQIVRLTKVSISMIVGVVCSVWGKVKVHIISI